MQNHFHFSHTIEIEDSGSSEDYDNLFRIGSKKIYQVEKEKKKKKEKKDRIPEH